MHRIDFRRTLPKDYAELKEFFFDDERKARLSEMGRLKRWFYTAAWLLKSLFLRLTPIRRVLVIIGIVLLMLTKSTHSDAWITIDFRSRLLPGAILLFVLMLELKDKLIARTELEEGRAVQSALMPEQRPQVPGWSLFLTTRTANDVGGDLVDFLQVDERRHLVSLADIAGKGLKAALVTSKLQSTLRALAPESPSLPQLASKINAVFHRDTIRTMFASLVCVEFSPGSGEVRLVNAGHLPPVHVTPAGLKELKKGDPAIGIFPEVRYSEQLLQLAPGETLLIYSDGLPDAKNVAGEFFGTGRLFEALSRVRGLDAAAIADHVLTAVSQFVGEAKVYDDLSMIVMKRAG